MIKVTSKSIATDSATRSAISWFDKEIAAVEDVLKELKRHKAEYLAARNDEKLPGKETFAKPEDRLSWAINSIKSHLLNSRIDLAPMIFADHITARAMSDDE